MTLLDYTLRSGFSFAARDYEGFLFEVATERTFWC